MLQASSMLPGQRIRIGDAPPRGTAQLRMQTSCVLKSTWRTRNASASHEHSTVLADTNARAAEQISAMTLYLSFSSVFYCALLTQDQLWRADMKVVEALIVATYIHHLQIHTHHDNIHLASSSISYYLRSFINSNKSTTAPAAPHSSASRTARHHSRRSKHNQTPTLRTSCSTHP